MCLVKSAKLFDEAAFPVMADGVANRAVKESKFHRHEYYEMLFAESAGLTCQFKGRAIRLNPGDVLIMKPYVLHRLNELKSERSRPVWYCSFLPQVVDQDIMPIDELAEGASPNRYFLKPFLSLAAEGVAAVLIKVDAAQCSCCRELFLRLRQTTHDRSERSRALSRFHFLSLLMFLSDQIVRGDGKGHDTVIADLVVSVSRCQTGLRNVLNHIHNHFDQSLKLESMAAMCDTETPYFCRMFKHETGETFTSYVNGLRIERACRMLLETTDNVLDISYEVGFNNYPCFTRQFKRRTGLAPSAYRKQAHGSGGWNGD